VRQYLTGCLDSVLGQAGSDFEVIAVDDASPDGSGDLLDERARHDSRLTVVHLEAKLGPGNARNVGLARATGRYVWFVDGDDMIIAGALDAVRARIDKLAAEPDVLLIDYLDLLPDGRSAPSAGADLMRSAPDGEFTLAERPQVISLTMTAWSKLFRRQFLVDLGEPFRSGIHEDIPVTCAALLTGTLGALGSPCYLYRRSRPGSCMVTSSTHHLAVFTAYGEVFGMLHKLGAAGDPVATPAVQSAVFERAIWHYAAVLQTTAPGIGRFGGPGLVPRSERGRFFERMHADFVRYVPAAYQLPGGARGAKLRLIKRGSYLTYELLEPVNRLRVAIRGRRRL
jgi:CDP-glycerol glycerophosphotransferase